MSRLAEMALESEVCWASAAATAKIWARAAVRDTVLIPDAVSTREAAMAEVRWVASVMAAETLSACERAAASA